jgi:hypothetical protein
MRLASPALQLLPSLIPVDGDDPRESVRIIGSSLRDTDVVGCFGLGVTGFCVETDVAVAVGTQATFEFRSFDGFSVILPAVAIHVRRSSLLRGEDLYMSTWEFTGEAAGTDSAIDLLVAAAAAGAER